MLHTLGAYAAAGLKNVELGATHSYLEGLEATVLKQFGLDFIVHSYFPPPREKFVVNLASQDDATLERSRKQIQRSIDFCQALGTDYFSFHSGFLVDPDEDFRFRAKGRAAPYERAFSTFMESLREIDSYAKQRGIRIAVENHGMPEQDLTDGKNMTYMFCEAWEFERLWETLPSRDIGMLLDLGHLKVAAQSLGFDREEFIDRVRRSVLSIHVHDNDGRADEHREVRDDSWCLDVLRRGGFSNARVVLESRGLAIDRIMVQVRLLQNALAL